MVKVTPSGVEVWVTATIFQTATPDGFTEVLEEHDGRLIRFDNKGCELDANRRDRLGFGPSPGDTFHNVLWFSAPEFQPWHLVPSVKPSAMAMVWAKAKALEPGQHERITRPAAGTVRCACRWSATEKYSEYLLERKILEHGEQIVRRHEKWPSPRFWPE